jgi:hypothetical protein
MCMGLWWKLLWRKTEVEREKFYTVLVVGQ